MRRILALAALVGLAAFALVSTSSAMAPAMWATKLTAAQEVPKQVVKNTKARGSFTAALTGSKLTFTLTFTGLTGSATAAHIHLGAMGQAGNVLVPLCTPCKSPVKGTVTVSSAVRKDFSKHLLYVNVHTAKNPNGEIRGQLGM